ncbi:hypothetical protein Bca52824_069769 [Brassica carinata]|uniref:Uncharacterized protein n=1 Tax=Brassica carinata TaxID=52824 RepID=A0A8X7Q5C8_BRACI|nr:hypothetical protein Bca52824_069769 [Brassica carinata]
MSAWKSEFLSEEPKKSAAPVTEEEILMPRLQPQQDTSPSGSPAPSTASIFSNEDFPPLNSPTAPQRKGWYSQAKSTLHFDDCEDKLSGTKVCCSSSQRSTVDCCDGS